MRLRFADYVLDLSERVLRHRDREIPLEPQVFACIALLAQHAGRLTSNEQLRATLWPGVRVAETSVRRAIREARKALGDDGDRQVVIRTRRGVGYVFLPKVTHEGAQPPGPAAPSEQEDLLSTAERALAAAMARWRADEPEAAVEAAFLEVAAAARRARAPVLMARAAIGLAVGDGSLLGLRMAPLRPGALDLAREAWQQLAGVEREQAPDAVAYRLATTLCLLEANTAPPLQLQRTAARALRLVRDVHAPLDRACAALLQLLADPTRGGSALESMQALVRDPALAPSERCEILPVLMACRLNRGEIDGWQWAACEAQRAAAELTVPAEDRQAGERLSGYLGFALTTVVTQDVIAGRLAQAEARFHDCAREAARLGLVASREALHNGFHILLQVYAYQGRSAELEPWVDAWLAQNPTSRWFCTLYKAQFALERGEIERARALLSHLRETELQPDIAGRRLPPSPETLLRLAELCVELGAEAELEQVYTALAPRAAQVIHDGALISWGACARPLAVLSRRLGRQAQAERYFQQALALNQRAGHRPELTRTRLGLAELLLGRGDREPANALLQQVTRDAAQMGMRRELAKASYLYAAHGGVDAGAERSLAP